MIIVPITAHSEKEALKQIAEANNAADTIEIRADLIKGNFDLEMILKKCRKPAIVTYRSRKEGGKFSGTQGKMVDAILKAIELKPEFIDVEYSMQKKLMKKLGTAARKNNVKVILSKHYSKSTPESAKVMAMFRGMAREKPFAVKIVTFAKKVDDNKVPIALLAESKERNNVQAISFCMGKKGLFSRIVSGVLGFATFASLGKGKESAPGQIEARKMRQILRGIGHA